MSERRQFVLGIIPAVIVMVDNSEMRRGLIVGWMLCVLAELVACVVTLRTGKGTGR